MTLKCFCALLLFFGTFSEGQRNPAYGTTNFEIKESVKRLDKNVRVLENKLTRHESREAQVADYSTKTLNALTGDQVNIMEQLKERAKQMTAVEERLMLLESLISTIDEGQRKKLDALSEGLNRLIVNQPKFELELPPVLPPPPPTQASNLGANALLKDLKKILRRVNVMDSAIRRDVKKVNNQVDFTKQSMKTLIDSQDRVLKNLNVCQKDQIKSITEASKFLSQTGTQFAKQITEAKQLFNQNMNEQSNNCKTLSNEVVDRLNALDTAYHDQEKELASLNRDTHSALREQKDTLDVILKETKNEKSLLSNYFAGVFQNLNEFDNHSKKRLGDLETTLKNIIKENSQDINKRVESVALVLRDTTNNILNILDDTSAMSENLQNSLTDNFDALTRDIRGLKKVEQVMLSTADAVLDTKRSIEFGIQQIILELSDAVKMSGKNIDSTLSDHISNISFAILKNQTTALTNMTNRMESEISQVWRQIGVMYQQIAQSVDLLGELKSTTSQQMNASLDKVGTMDGTVGAINNKVADVEDNLNYLLGRLSIVVSQFSDMRTGVGSELNRLREMTEEFSENKKVVEYQLNKKRSAPDLDESVDDAV